MHSMETNSRLYLLLKKYLDGHINLIEQDELFDLVLNESNSKKLLDQIESDLYLEEEANSTLPPQIAEEIIINILKSEPEVNNIINLNKSKATFYKKLAIAAVMIGLVCLTYFSSSILNNQKNSFATIIPQHIDYKMNKTSQVQEVLLSDSIVAQYMIYYLNVSK